MDAPNIRISIVAAMQKLGDRMEAELLLAHVLNTSRSWLIAHAEDMLDETTARQFAQLVDRRAAGEPIAYLTGVRGFWSLDLEVTPATLIPRPETELLVELALERLPLNKSVQVLDLGTGSGAIALAVASERPQAQITATDASQDALVVAQRNARHHHLVNVSFAHGDWFAPLADRRFDLIVSNPPYIESGDVHLRQGDLRYEPASALASGEDGLNDIRRIVRAAPSHLVHGGWLMFEHGWNQGDAARLQLCSRGFVEVFTAQDIEQRDRVTAGRFVS
jgi:release factor glutamine methyltransferase